MTSPSEPRTPRLYHVATPRAAAILAGLAIATIYSLQIVLAQLGAPLVVASVAGDLVTGAGLVWLARRHRYDLGLRWPRPRFIVAGLLVGASTWMVALQIVAWLHPPGDDHQLGQVVQRGALWPLVVGLAVLPAFTEELVFRGVLARGLATRWPAWAAIAGSAAVFAAYHLIPAQMIGVLPLGLALGLLAIRSRSIVPGMIAHLTNNTIALALSRDELPGIARVLGARPGVSLLAASVVLVAGVALAIVRIGTRAEPGADLRPRK